MSVDKRRLAAAQRTAALRTTSTTERLCAWIIIVPALALFSFSVVAGAAGFGAKPDLTAARREGDAESTQTDHGSVGGRRVVEGLGQPESRVSSGKASGTRSAGSRAAQLTRVSASVPARRRRRFQVGQTAYGIVTRLRSERAGS